MYRDNTLKRWNFWGCISESTELIWKIITNKKAHNLGVLSVIHHILPQKIIATILEIHAGSPGQKQQIMLVETVECKRIIKTFSDYAGTFLNDK